MAAGRERTNYLTWFAISERKIIGSHSFVAPNSLSNLDVGFGTIRYDTISQFSLLHPFLLQNPRTTKGSASG